MGKGNRPATCAATNKRLRGKSWYYRDGKYFYNKRAWEQDQEKKATEAAKTAAESKKAEAAA